MTQIATQPATPTQAASPPLADHTPASNGQPAPAASAIEPKPAPSPPGLVAQDIPLDDIIPSPYQPRSEIDDETLQGLAESIRSAGVIQPIVVRESQQRGRYELIAGERRWRASRLAGNTTIPAIIRQADEQRAAEWALIENIQREDLNPIERSEALRRLQETFDWTQQQIAERVGLERSTVANLMRLADLEDEIRSKIAAGKLATGHAKALLSLPAGTRRTKLAELAVKGSWSVRKLESEARKQSQSEHTSSQGNHRSPDLESLERHLGEFLGTRVRIKVSSGGKQGEIGLRFFDLDHFDALLAKMGYNTGEMSDTNL
ncbi:MAG: ParB/RepB/Spo0J family partition protein [Planctomycetota bacterium]